MSIRISVPGLGCTQHNRADLQERLGKLRREQALRLGEGLKLLLSIEV